MTTSDQDEFLSDSGSDFQDSGAESDEFVPEEPAKKKVKKNREKNKRRKRYDARNA